MNRCEWKPAAMMTVTCSQAIKVFPNFDSGPKQCLHQHIPDEIYPAQNASTVQVKHVLYTLCS